MLREVEVEVHFDNKDYDRLVSRIGKKSIGPYIRSLTLQHLGDQSPLPVREDIQDLMLQVKRIGVNVNQVARKMNAKGEAPEYSELAGHVQQLHSLLLQKIIS